MIDMLGVLIGVGTRPEVVKMAPVIRALEKEGQSFIFVHSGQHYDYNMSLQFIEELELPKPDYGLEVRGESAAAQTGRIMIAVEGVVKMRARAGHALMHRLHLVQHE